MKLNRYFLIVANLIIIAMLLLWAFKNINIAEVVKNLSLVSFEYFFVAIVLHIVALAVYSARLSFITGYGLSSAFGATNISYGLNAILPLRLGDALRLYLVKQIYKMSVAKMTSATIVEKLYDLVLILAMATMAFLFTYDEKFLNYIIKISIFCSLLVLAIYFLHIFLVNRGVAKQFFLGEKLLFVVDLLKEQLTFDKILKNILFTVAIWLISLSIINLACNTFLSSSTEIHFSVRDSVILLIIITLALSLPSAPAGIGIFEAGVVGYLTYNNGTSKEVALSIALLLHACVTLPQILLMSGTLIKYKWRLLHEIKHNR